MKTLYPPLRILAIFLAMYSVIATSQLNAQTILIDSTFSSDGEIFPFSQNDTINGLSISGSVNLFSDTSLVRVILSDTSGNEWMVNEAYPLISSELSFDFDEECDETCYLDELVPNSIKIQILNASINIDSINYTVEGMGDMSILQLQSKRNKDLQKTSSINQSINEKGWDWVAETTSIVKMFFHEKINVFRYKYNLLGMDYYAGGSYMNDRLGDGMIDTTDFTKSFDWRKIHDAHIDTSFYFDGNPDRHVELFDLLTDIYVDTCEIDSTLQDRLEDIYNETGTLPGIYARNLLMAHELSSYKEPVYLAENQLKKSHVNHPDKYKTNENSSYLSVFPNPSRTFFIIEFDLQEFAEPGIILISDQNGRTLKKQFLHGMQNQIIISNDQFSSGVYLVQLFVGNKLHSVEKIVIQ